MRLKNPGGVEQAVQILRQLSAGVANTMFSGRAMPAARDAWLTWFQQADAQLRNLFTDTEIADDLYRTQLEVQKMGEDALPYIHLARVIEVWQTKLNETVAALEKLQPFVSRPGRIVVPDTSAFIEGLGLLEADWHSIAGASADELVRLILPILVIEELDDNKRHRNPRVMERARETLKSLWSLPAHPNGGKIVKSGIGVELLMDDPWHERRPVNDVEIVDRATYIKDLTGNPVTLAAADYAILFRASESRLIAAPIPLAEK
jgi:hypothetical protein